MKTRIKINMSLKLISTIVLSVALFACIVVEARRSHHHHHPHHHYHHGQHYHHHYTHGTIIITKPVIHPYTVAAMTMQHPVIFSLV